MLSQSTDTPPRRGQLAVRHLRKARLDIRSDDEQRDRFSAPGQPLLHRCLAAEHGDRRERRACFVLRS